MNKNEITSILSVEIIKKSIEGIEQKFSDLGALKNTLTYDKDSLNKYLKSEFDLFSEILQKFVDSYYASAYLVDSFVPFALDDFDFCIEHNSKVLNNIKKLVKFVE